MYYRGAVVSLPDEVCEEITGSLSSRRAGLLHKGMILGAAALFLFHSMRSGASML